MELSSSDSRFWNRRAYSSTVRPASVNTTSLAELGFEALQRERNRGLRARQFLGGTRETALIGDRHEYPEGAQLHGTIITLTDENRPEYKKDLLPWNVRFSDTRSGPSGRGPRETAASPNGPLLQRDHHTSRCSRAVDGCHKGNISRAKTWRQRHIDLVEAGTRQSCEGWSDACFVDEQ